MRHIIENNRGMTTFIALMLMIMLTMIGLAAIKLANDEINIAGNEMNETNSFYAAESGLERAAAAIQTYYEKHGAPPAALPSGTQMLGDCFAAYVTKVNGTPTTEVLVQGTLAGLTAQVQSYDIVSTSVSNIDQSQMTLTMQFKSARIPIFQYGVFYEDDLEMSPGTDMTLVGRVHSNGRIFVQSGTNLYMGSYLTSKGTINHGPKGPGATVTGNIFIKDTDGNYQNMKNGDGTFLTSTTPNWYNKAVGRWDGRVQDTIFGQEQLTIPLIATADHHQLIERATGNPDSYENDATLKIIDGVAYAEVGGAWINVTGLLPVNTITNTLFTDLREGQVVNSTNIDLSLLKLSSYYPSNGIIYVSDSRSAFDGARLVNGSDLGRPLTVVSENPLYVQGDYNTVLKQPAALIADAVTFLSNSWDDTKSSMPLSQRHASATSVNASIMTGVTTTTSTYYNGGLENLPRLLEDWNGKQFSLNGSMVALWNSQQANSPWSYGTYYTAPHRNWTYDTDLDNPANHPPGTPTLQVFHRTSWKQQDIEYSLKISGT